MSRKNTQVPGGAPPQGGAPQGFTLIEVLVVVAIIALLIAILIPSLVGARNEAQAAVCASNLKQVMTGVQTHLLEEGMRRERVSTNFGWATYSFKVNKYAREIFTCPADIKPLPTVPVFADIYEGSTFHGRTASCGVFNDVLDRGGGTWDLDIQDSVDERGFGRDSSTNDIDLLLTYTAHKGDITTSVGVKQVESSWNFKVYNHKGQTLWSNPRGAGGQYALPLIWLSYGANAAAGLRNTKGNPIVIVENKRQGVFPESYAGRSIYGGGQVNDELKKILRFRHGSKLHKTGYGDGEYVVRDRLGAAFRDGHVEKMLYSQVTGEGRQVDGNGDLIWHRNIWLGIRRGNEGFFD